MLQITEDTPPDMLAGAMDLTVHLPNGRSVKMSVKRSMPMMDLLMHIATIHNLQLSEHTLEALSMAPSPDHIDKFLPFKPNTPIGVIDTQHIKVLPKPKPIVKQRMAPQPFESTFRLKVHLPRNQLYVTRVSRNVLLENILKKACEEKNLDWKKYALHHPGNLDEVLDPKLTLNDYQITEVYLVAKGTVNLNQAFSASDLMILRKEEERKRMQAKTGGGVLSLIFGRNNNKSSMGSGSLSSENRSISPTHSDDSRSVTPPAIPQQIITPPPKQDPEKPKPPQRKRRPAPKPPTNNERKNSDVKPASNISDNSDVQEQKADNNLTICHSRNSSDSSGYHEASILSDNCNTSLPRRPQSALIGSANVNNLSKQHSQSTTNLSKMSSHSKSTSSLAFAGRKKKAAPPPPPGLKSSTSVTNLALPSPVVASQAPASIPPAESSSQTQVKTQLDPKPLPRRKAPTPSQRSSLKSIPDEKLLTEIKEHLSRDEFEPELKPNNVDIVEAIKPTIFEKVEFIPIPTKAFKEADKLPQVENEITNADSINQNLPEQLVLYNTTNVQETTNEEKNYLKSSISLPNMINLQESKETVKPPEIVGVIPKAKSKTPTKFDTFSKRTCYKIGMSLLDDNDNASINSKLSLESESSSITSALNKFKFVDEYDDIDENLFTGSLSKKSTGSKVFNELHGIYTDEGIKKWKNFEELDNLSQYSLIDARNNVVTGGSSFDTESLTSTNYTQATPFDSLASHLSSSEINSVTETSNTQALESPVVDLPAEDNKVEETIKSEPTIKPSSKITSKEEETVIEPEPIVAQIEIKTETPQFDETDKSSDIEAKEVEWQYQLPPPPEGFRDNNNYIEASTTQNATIKSDSVVTSPELFEKLKVLEDNQSEPGTIDSTVSEEEKPVINTNLSLENLEKRKSLVYNRELATSLKMTDKNDSFTTSLNKFESTYEEIRRSSLTRDYSQEPKFQPTVKRSTSTLPNFKIATYDNPKKNITVFEDDTVRSNTDSVLKKNIFNENKTEIKTNLTKSYIGRSMENISFRKNSWGNQSDDDKSKTKETGLSLYRPQSMMASKNSFGPSSMHRSESFSTEKHWSPTKPVSRSKSQLTLNKYKEEKATYKSLEPITKSNSLLDVSGLQSIGVMKLIQNRLKTPTTSLENVNHQEKLQQSTFKPIISSAPEVKEKPVNTYQYRGPPSINLSTWSERPKAQVTLKEDNDYKIKNVSSKLIVNTTNNNITSNNRIEVNNSHKYDTNYNSNGSVNVRVGSFQVEPKNVTIKVNGTEPISSENSGNVVIKIGSNNTQNGVGPDNQRFISHTTAIGYRRPLGNVNKFLSQRPHSIAVDSDISHVPVVRSVELKKPYRDMNTSITQIYQTNPLRTNTHNRNSYDSKNEVYKSTENISQTESKPVTRVNSMIRNFTPVVRGFNNTTENNFNNNNRYSTTSPNIYTVNKPKENDNFSTNKDVPFSQSNLRRTESNKIINAEPKYQSDSKINFINKKNSDYNFYAVNKPDVIQPPPPPMMPKMEIKKRPRQIEPKEDPRDQLLNAIRNFGGKKGLKSVKS